MNNNNVTMLKKEHESPVFEIVKVSNRHFFVASNTIGTTGFGIGNSTSDLSFGGYDDSVG